MAYAVASFQLCSINIAFVSLDILEIMYSVRHAILRDQSHVLLLVGFNGTNLIAPCALSWTTRVSQTVWQYYQHEYTLNRQIKTTHWPSIKAASSSFWWHVLRCRRYSTQTLGPHFLLLQQTLVCVSSNQSRPLQTWTVLDLSLGIVWSLVNEQKIPPDSFVAPIWNADDSTAILNMSKGTRENIYRRVSRPLVPCGWPGSTGEGAWISKICGSVTTR